MNRTGVFLTTAEFNKIEWLSEPTVELSAVGNLVITRPSDKKAAWKLLSDIATRHGLLALPGGQCYGVDINRELIAP